MKRVCGAFRSVAVGVGMVAAGPGAGAVCLLPLAAPLAGQETDLARGEDPLARFVLTEPAAVLRLPNRLREISGLAVAGDGRLFAHDDERAVIYEVDPRAGELVKAFALGDPVARADYEGIAIVEDRFYLVSSDGVIYEGAEGADDERLVFNTYGTGLGRRCEIEGLAHDPVADVLLLPCKTVRDESLRPFVTIFRWSLTERMVADPPVLIDLAAVEEATEQRHFAVSGIARDPISGAFVLIAGPDRAIVSVSRDGEVLGGARLDGDLHRQAEGIEFGSDGRLFIADEGAGRRARITAYAAIP